MTGLRYAGYAVSLTVHLAIAAAVLIVPFEAAVRHKSVVIDFSVIRGPGHDIPGGAQGSGPSKDYRDSGAHKTRSPSRTLRTAALNKGPTRVEHRTAALQESVGSAVSGGYHADAQGEIAVAAGASRGGPAAAAPGSAGGTGLPGAKMLNYTGGGGAEERNFSFIRDRIMQGIIYPERARRMGWEGRVTLSFTVLENGSINDVKVVTSSGFSILDESARDSVAKTNLKRKVPVRLVVLLPVEYRLR